ENPRQRAPPPRQGATTTMTMITKMTATAMATAMALIHMLRRAKMAKRTRVTRIAWPEAKEKTRTRQAQSKSQKERAMTTKRTRKRRTHTQDSMATRSTTRTTRTAKAEIPSTRRSKSSILRQSSGTGAPASPATTTRNHLLGGRRLGRCITSKESTKMLHRQLSLATVRGMFFYLLPWQWALPLRHSF
ncbi:hypothetical protein GGI22_004929, partial [Coemansia erecta]